MLRCIYRNRLPFLAVLFAAMPALLYGQGSARISGTVTDPAGAVISGATVALTQTATGQTLSMVSSAAGAYTFLDLTPGLYDLNVKAQGFKAHAQTGIIIQVGHAITLNVSMELGSVTTR